LAVSRCSGKEEKKKGGEGGGRREGEGETRHWWLTPIVLATQEAEIKRITVQRQPGQIVCETLSRKKPSQKRAGGVAQGVGPEFKPQYHQKKRRRKRKKKRVKEGEKGTEGGKRRKKKGWRKKRRSRRRGRYQKTRVKMVSYDYYMVKFCSLIFL
jgi:hypothetical protein